MSPTRHICRYDRSQSQYLSGIKVVPKQFPFWEILELFLKPDWQHAKYCMCHLRIIAMCDQKRRDYQELMTNGQTDGRKNARQSDPYVLLCFVHKNYIIYQYSSFFKQGMQILPKIAPIALKGYMFGNRFSLRTVSMPIPQRNQMHLFKIKLWKISA